MRVPLRTRGARLACVALGLLLAAAIETFFLTQWLASHKARQPNPVSLTQAIRLDPWNAAYPNLLGNYFLNVVQDPVSALPYLKRATELNPLKGRYWLDLAGVSMLVGNDKDHGEALQRAVQAEPTSPAVASEVGNYMLIQGDIDGALKNLSVVELYDPLQRSQALATSWRATHNIDLLLQRTPATPEVRADLLAVMVQQNQMAAAAKVWAGIAAQSQPIPVDYAFNYMNVLLTYGRRDVAQAQKVWSDLVRLNPAFSHYEQNDDNLVNNPGFEYDILGGGFDWMYTQVPNVALSQDTPDFHSGSRSMAITFDVEGADNFGLMQHVPVTPDTAYRFTAYTKAEDIEGGSGPRIAVVDPYAGAKRFYASEDAHGTTSWQAQEGEFRTGPATKVVAIAVVRDPDPDRVHGKFWVDDVELVRIAPAKEK